MAAEDLCSLADVRALYGKKPADTAQDAIIASFITRASVAVMNFCDRQFAPKEEAVTKVFEFPWESQLVSLAPYDLVSVSEIIVDTDQPVGVVLSTSEWRLWPQPPRNGTYLSLRVQPFGAAVGRVLWRNRQLQVRGNWGFPSVPPDVTMATAATVVHWLREYTAAFRPPAEEQNIASMVVRAIPREAYDLLSQFKRSNTI